MLSNSLPQPGGEHPSELADNPTDQGTPDAVGPTPASDPPSAPAVSSYQAAYRPSPSQDDAATTRVSGALSRQAVSPYHQLSSSQDGASTTTRCFSERMARIAWPEWLHLGSIFVGVLIGVVGTGLAVRSADDQLRLSKWTTRKDFREYCSQERAIGASPAGCSEALDWQLPPPPLARRGVHPGLPLHQRDRTLLYGASSDKETVHATIFAFPLILLLLWVLSRRRALRSAYRWSRSGVASYSPSRPPRDAPVPLHPTISTMSQGSASSFTVEGPAQTSTLRHRRPGVEDVTDYFNLVRAASRNDAPLVRRLLDDGADVCGTDRDGSTALHWLASNGHGEMLELLLRRGADVNALDGKQWQPIHYAVSEGNALVLETLLRWRADVGNQTTKHTVLLRLAVERGHAKVVESLLSAGAWISAGVPGHVALVTEATSLDVNEVADIMKYNEETSKRGRRRDERPGRCSSTFPIGCPECHSCQCFPYAGSGRL